MFKPGSVLWLLRHEIRVTWRGAFDKKNSNAGRYVFYAFLAAVTLAGGLGLAWFLGEIPAQATPESIGIINAIFAVIATFMVSHALIQITEALYQRGDLDLLLASPLPAWRVLLVRMGAIALNVAAFYLALALAIFVFLPFTGGWRWMGLVPALLALALIATALSILVARVLFQLIGPRATRTGAQVLAALAGAGFFLAMQAQNFVPYEERAAFFRRALEQLALTLGNPDSIISIPARAAMGEVLPLLGWLALGIGAYVLAVWWFARRFVANAAAIASLSVKKKRNASIGAMRGGLAATLVRKEWRLLLRDPLLLSQVLLQLVYLLPLVFILWRGVGDGEFTRGSLGAFSGALVLLAAHLSASLVWLTVSAEDAPDLIAAAPVKRDAIDMAKAIAAGAPVAALMLLPVAAAVFVSPMAAFWLLIGTLAAIGSAGLIGIWHQRPGDRKAFRRRRGQSLGASFGQFFVTMGWAGATGLAVAGWALLGIIPLLIAIGTLLALHESRPAPAQA